VNHQHRKIAACGIADCRGIKAAMMLGAECVQCGTVYLASNECYISDKYKELVLNATEVSTVVTGRPSGHPVRSLKTPIARKCLELEKQNTDTSLEELEKATAGSLRNAVHDGNYKEGTFMSGQIAGMLNELHPCEEILNGMTAQAEDLLKNAYKRFE
jgi:Dioxygenases related to 2-nitropropane dioxygenase